MVTQETTEFGDLDSQWFVLRPGTDREERFRRVTGPLGRWDKDGLLPWAAGLAAKGAFDELTALMRAAVTQDCGRTYGRCALPHDWNVKCPDCRCRVCEECLVRWMRDRHEAESHRRTDEGERIHGVLRDWVATGVWVPVADDIEPYIKTLRVFIAEYGLRPQDWELYEARVLNRTHGYSGTLDAAVHFHRDRSKASFDLLDRLTPEGGQRLDHALILIDYKSREKPDRAIFMDMSLQLAAYRYGETLLLRDGTELPMFAVDATAIVQIRPDQTSLELVLAEEPEFATYLSLLAADGWALERGKRAIGARTFSYPESIKKLRARESARRRSQERKELAATTAAEMSDAELDQVSAMAARVAEKTQDDTPQARGARAAAAARRGVSPVLAEIAQANGKNVGRATVVPHVEKQGVPGRTVTLEAAVLGPAHHGKDDEIPF